ncbi:hypothetical protein CAPN004_03180 [Capnocytophaga cynodegmi]|nr:hypothetical protein CAPN004_03180 [Capnocytophaga cynodegmi]
MDKKLAKIKENIENSAEDFNCYFYSKIDVSVKSFIDTLKTKTSVFLFSGIIRDYFIKNINEFRDIDLVIEDDLAIENIFKNLNYKKNSFGGYKIAIGKTVLDLWVVKNTWGLQRQSNLGYVQYLPETTFFNFSSILFSLNNKVFIIGKDFLKFIQTKKIEVVYEENPYPELCIVNTLYYKQKMNCELGNRLKNYIRQNYPKTKDKLEMIQQKHFNEIKYSSIYIEQILEKGNYLK